MEYRYTNGKYYTGVIFNPRYGEYTEEQMLEKILQDFLQGKLNSISVTNGRREELALWKLDKETGFLTSDWSESAFDVGVWLIASGEPWDVIRIYLDNTDYKFTTDIEVYTIDVVIDSMIDKAKKLGRQDLIPPLLKLKSVVEKMKNLLEDGVDINSSEMRSLASLLKGLLRG